MNALTFDGFDDTNIASWIWSDFFGSGIEEKRKPQARQHLKSTTQPSGFDLKSFIARGLRNTLDKLAGSRELLAQSIDLSSQKTHGTGSLSFDIASAGPSETTVAGAPVAGGRTGSLNLSSLLAPETRAALGNSGQARLASFSRLAPGWDDGAGESLNLDSLQQLDRFFAASKLSPNSLGIFMSQDGNLITNWPGPEEMLIELEFSNSEISAFFEADGNTLVGEVGDNRFLEKIKNKFQ